MNSTYETLLVENIRNTLLIKLNRPQVHNAFNTVMLAELIGLLKEIDQNDTIRAIIITGMGKSFCAGADLNWLKAVINYSYQENLAESETISELFYTIYTLSKPVIAAINGAAVGGGMGFVGAADYVIASEHARFSLSEVRIGVVPACISPYLLKKAPEGALKDLFISGKRFDAKTAQTAHLINEEVVHDQLLEKALEKADSYKICGPQAIKMCKQLFHIVPQMELKEAYHATADLIAKMRISPEAQEGMKAFLEKRNPSWHETDSTQEIPHDRK